jgi:hypothetical protein
VENGKHKMVFFFIAIRSFSFFAVFYAMFAVCKHTRTNRQEGLFILFIDPVMMKKMDRDVVCMFVCALYFFFLHETIDTPSPHHMASRKCVRLKKKSTSTFLATKKSVR